MDTFITQYLSHLESNDASWHTIDGYRRYLRRFSDLVTKPCLISRMTIDAYETRLHSLGLSQRSKALHLIALRSFLSFLADRDIPTLDYRKIKLKKAERTKVEPPSDEEARILFGEAKKDPLTNALYQVIYSTGMRIHEVRQLSRSIPSSSLIIKGKGKKERHVMFSPKSLEAIAAWNAIRTDESTSLFPHDVRTLKALLIKHACKCGLRGRRYSAHGIRRFAATKLYEQTHDIVLVQGFLGHASAETTRAYIGIRDGRLAEAHQLMPQF